MCVCTLSVNNDYFSLLLKSVASQILKIFFKQINTCRISGVDHHKYSILVPALFSNKINTILWLLQENEHSPLDSNSSIHSINTI